MDQRRDNAAVGLSTERERLASPSFGRRVIGMPPVVPVNSTDSAVDRTYALGDREMSRLLTVDEVASWLNVPRKWVYRRVSLKPPMGIPHMKVGKYLRFLVRDVQDYVESLRRN